MKKKAKFDWASLTDEDWASGAVALSLRAGVSRQAVEQRMKRRKNPKPSGRPRAPRPENLDLALSAKKTAAAHGVSVGTASAWLQEAGVTFTTGRPKGT